MTTQIIVPALGESIVEANLLAWLKKVGDPVKRGEEIAQLETAKATMPLECPANGVLLSILVTEGTPVIPGQALAIVGQPGEVVEVEVPPMASSTVPQEPVAALPQPEGPQPTGAQRISPAARRLADELGLDLSTILPSTPGARITTEDIQRYLKTGQAEARLVDRLPYHRVALNEVRKVVAERMSASASQIPQFSVSLEANATRMLETKKELMAKGIEVSLTALLVQSVCRALQGHPLVNARFSEDSILVYETVNMAVAVATPHGLMAPVIHAAEKLSLQEIARQLNDLTLAARENRLSLSQVTDGTFTLSNLGMYGVSQFVPLVNPPQAAILGVGSAKAVLLPTPQGGIQPAWLTTLTVSADHRVLDGEAVAQFLGSLQKEIEAAQFKI